MAKLIYSTNMSLDGYIEDPDGRFDWSMPDEEVHQFFNDLVRTVGTHLSGRRMYETMMVWETDPSLAAQSPILQDFAEAWKSADKIGLAKAANQQFIINQIAQKKDFFVYGVPKPGTNHEWEINMITNSGLYQEMGGFGSTFNNLFQYIR